MNKKIIFFTTPAYGHMLSVIPVIKKLIDVGYQIDCYSSKRFENMIKKCNANFIEYKIDFENYILKDITSNFFELTKALVDLNENVYKEYINEIDYTDVDLIIYDSMCSFGKNIAFKHNIKSICFVTTLAFNLPVFLFSNLFTSTVPLYLKHLKEFKSLFKREKIFRKKEKLQRLKVIDLFVNSGDKTIIFSPKEFQPFYKTFPKSFHFVGTTIKERCEFENLFEEKSDKKYDYCFSLGTISTENLVLYDEWLNNEYMKDKEVIISAGNSNIENKNTKHTIKQRINQIQVLKNCDYFINHAGLNSVFESIYYGVPQICIPQQQEQRHIAKIVQKNKVGFYAPKYNIKYLKEIEKIKDSNKLIKWKECIRSYDGTNNAFKVIDDFIKEKK